ncbi:MAG: HAMP domain-containing protein [Desulfobacteraceae bacterium]|nr:MAG: HAMP domain-containing protein [Desulfobacteraceae bacterium]
MSSKKRAEIRRSLAFRLTLWYAGVFLLSAGIAFVFFLYLITTTLRGRTDQDLLAGVKSFSTVMARQGMEAVKRQAVLESQAAGEKQIFIQLVFPDGRLFSSSNMSYFQHIPVSIEAIRRMLEQGEPLFATVRSPDRSHEIRVVYARLGPGLVIHLGQAMEDLARVIDAFQKVFLVVMAALFILAAGVGWFMARRALSGVERVTRTAQGISGGSLTERVPVRGRGDEVDQLAVTFNQMLDRIETLVTGIKEMTDNIAHDLKSPITRIRGQAELALTGEGSREEYETMAGSTVEECDRLLAMIDTMLFISRTEAGVTQPELREVDLAAVVADACRLFQALAEEKRIRLSCDSPKALTISGDIRLLQRMLANLLDNAIKYTPPEGSVRVSARRVSPHQVSIEVADTGPGISQSDLPHVFERFYRGDPSRTQAGAGLGLSFARAVARVHGGDITAVSPGAGSVFAVSIPCRSA